MHFGLVPYSSVLKYSKMALASSSLSPWLAMGEPLNSTKRSLAKGASVTIFSGLSILFVTHPGVRPSTMPLGAGPLHGFPILWHARHVLLYTSSPLVASSWLTVAARVTDVMGPTPLLVRSMRSEAFTSLATG